MAKRKNLKIEKIVDDYIKVSEIPEPEITSEQITIQTTEEVEVVGIAKAEELGCEIVKLFPGDLYGPNFVKGIKGPQPWTSIMPTGGVSPTQENLKGWFDAGVTCVGMGSQLISKDIIANKDYAKLEQDVKNAMAIIKSIRE